MEDRKKDFGIIISEIDALIERGGERDEVLQGICDILREKVEYYDWVGFYLTVPGQEELALGPFNGASTDHTCIPFGKGVCGQAAAKKETIVIQDVAGETNYLSCSPDVKSEIVVPLMRSGEVLGELDIDSHAISPFTERDRELLEHVAASLVKVLEQQE